MADEVFGFKRKDSDTLIGMIDQVGGVGILPSQRPQKTPTLMRMFKTPSGGIPAASGTTPGSATCTEYPDGMAGAAGATSVVKNHRTSIIPGDVFILVQAFGSDLYCIEGNCPIEVLPP